MKVDPAGLAEARLIVSIVAFLSACGHLVVLARAWGAADYSFRHHRARDLALDAAARRSEET